VLDNSAIELGDGATLDLFVDGDVEIIDGFIGEASIGGPDLDSSGHAPWMDPQRIHVFGSAAGTVSGWSVSGNSVVKASLYAPSGRVTIGDQSAVYGRLAADRVSMHEDAAVFYDHTLDSGFGYTKPDSLVFAADGSIPSSFVAIGSLAEGTLAEAAAHTDLAISAYGKTYYQGQRYDGDFVPGTSDVLLPPDPAAPTPRPAVVEFEFGAFGADITGWEQGSS
jgi:hypothetical protein